MACNETYIFELLHFNRVQEDAMKVECQLLYLRREGTEVGVVTRVLGMVRVTWVGKGLSAISLSSSAYMIRVFSERRR